MPKVREFDKMHNNPTGWFVINCPGCEQEHQIAVGAPFTNGAKWLFNGDMNKPTFSPSLHVKTGKYANPSIVEGKSEKELEYIEEFSSICHSFIREGMIEFLGDCTHKLAGQTVELLDIENRL
jgi:hypothetical protein